MSQNPQHSIAGNQPQQTPGTFRPNVPHGMGHLQQSLLGLVNQPQHAFGSFGSNVPDGMGQYQGLPAVPPRLEPSREFFEKAFASILGIDHINDKASESVLQPWGTFIGDIYDSKVYLSERPPAGPVPDHITHILSAANAVFLHKPQLDRFLQVDSNMIYDAALSPDGDIHPRHLEKIYSAGKDISRAEGHLLVFDHHGVSRGPAAIAMIFMKFRNRKLMEVLHLFESKGIKLKFDRDVGRNLLELERDMFPNRPENILSPTGDIRGPVQHFHHNAGIGFGHPPGYVSHQQLQNVPPPMQTFVQNAPYQNVPTVMGQPLGPRTQCYIEHANHQNVPAALGQPFEPQSQGFTEHPQYLNVPAVSGQPFGLQNQDSIGNAQYQNIPAAMEQPQGQFWHEVGSGQVLQVPPSTPSPEQWQTSVHPGFPAELLTPPQDNDSQYDTPEHHMALGQSTPMERTTQTANLPDGGDTIVVSSGPALAPQNSKKRKSAPGDDTSENLLPRQTDVPSNSNTSKGSKQEKAKEPEKPQRKRGRPPNIPQRSSFLDIDEESRLVISLREAADRLAPLEQQPEPPRKRRRRSPHPDDVLLFPHAPNHPNNLRRARLEFEENRFTGIQDHPIIQEPIDSTPQPDSTLQELIFIHSREPTPEAVSSLYSMTDEAADKSDQNMSPDIDDHNRLRLRGGIDQVDLTSDSDSDSSLSEPPSEVPDEFEQYESPTSSDHNIPSPQGGCLNCVRNCYPTLIDLTTDSDPTVPDSPEEVPHIFEQYMSRAIHVYDKPRGTFYNGFREPEPEGTESQAEVMREWDLPERHGILGEETSAFDDEMYATGRSNMMEWMAVGEFPELNSPQESQQPEES